MLMTILVMVKKLPILLQINFLLYMHTNISFCHMSVSLGGVFDAINRLKCSYSFGSHGILVTFLWSCVYTVLSSVCSC